MTVSTRTRFEVFKRDGFTVYWILRRWRETGERKDHVS